MTEKEARTEIVEVLDCEPSDITLEYRPGCTVTDEPSSWTVVVSGEELGDGGSLAEAVAETLAGRDLPNRYW